MADYQWRKAGDLTTKAEISAAVNVASTSKDWALKVANAFKSSPRKSNIIVSVAIALSGLSAAIFYSNYETALREVLYEIEALPAKQDFYVQQRYRWHSGKRSWTPMAVFRVVEA